MSSIVTPTKSLLSIRNDAKSKTRFQKLWEEAETVKARNVALEASLDGLVTQIENEIKPVEQELGVAMRAQIDKLFVFARRKSLSNWQLQVLDDWIDETLCFLHPLGLVDEAMQNSLIQWQADSYGIQIDVNSEVPFSDQLKAGLDAQFNSAGCCADDRSSNEEVDTEPYFNGQFTCIDSDEVSVEEESGAEEGRARSDQVDNEFVTEQSDKDQPAAVFKMLFHRVARALHPDKEVDPDRVAAKQTLMSELLDARRQHDLMRVVELYRTHVNDTVEFSQNEITELERVLHQYIEFEQHRFRDIISKSYWHEIAFHEFYNEDAQKTERSVVRKIKQIKSRKVGVEAFTTKVTSLKKLRPYLKSRYDRDYY